MPTKPKQSGGRPTLYQREIGAKVIALMAEGRSLDGCAALIGLHPDTMYEWQKRHPEFSEAVRAGRAAATTFWENRLIAVAAGEAGNAQAIQWALRNRSKAAAGWDHDRHKLEHSGPDGGPIAAPPRTIDPALLTKDERDNLRCMIERVTMSGDASII